MMSNKRTQHFMRLWASVQDDLAWRACCALNDSADATCPRRRRRYMDKARCLAQRSNSAFMRHIEAGARLR